MNTWKDLIADNLADAMHQRLISLPRPERTYFFSALCEDDCALEIDDASAGEKGARERVPVRSTGAVAAAGPTC